MITRKDWTRWIAYTIGLTAFVTLILAMETFSVMGFIIQVAIIVVIVIGTAFFYAHEEDKIAKRMEDGNAWKSYYEDMYNKAMERARGASERDVEYCDNDDGHRSLTYNGKTIDIETFNKAMFVYNTLENLPDVDDKPDEHVLRTKLKDIYNKANLPADYVEAKDIVKRMFDNEPPEYDISDLYSLQDIHEAYAYKNEDWFISDVLVVDKQGEEYFMVPVNRILDAGKKSTKGNVE